MTQFNQTPQTSRSFSLNSPLWKSLESFRVDEPDTPLSFVKRLARENRWPVSYAERVFNEYKRFVFLAIAADHRVTPSDEVDQAWHLHLAYTESYWTEMCGKLLGQPLHHGPTKGGQQEDNKYFDLYARTLESYEHFFGHKPPADIWPSPAKSSQDAELRAATAQSEHGEDGQCRTTTISSSAQDRRARCWRRGSRRTRATRCCWSRPAATRTSSLASR